MTATLALCFSVGQAAAEESDPGAAQAAGQSAASGQDGRRQRRRLPGRGNEPDVRHPGAEPRLEW